jgi:hypothetical protein
MITWVFPKISESKYTSQFKVTPITGTVSLQLGKIGKNANEEEQLPGWSTLQCKLMLYFTSPSRSLNHRPPLGNEGQPADK